MQSNLVPTFAGPNIPYATSYTRAGACMNSYPSPSEPACLLVRAEASKPTGAHAPSLPLPTISLLAFQSMTDAPDLVTYSLLRQTEPAFYTSYTPLYEYAV